MGISLSAYEKRDGEGNETSDWVEVTHPLPELVVATVRCLGIVLEGVHEQPEDGEWAPELDADTPPPLEGRFPPFDLIVRGIWWFGLFLAEVHHFTRQLSNTSEANELAPFCPAQARNSLRDDSRNGDNDPKSEWHNPCIRIEEWDEEG